MTREEAINQLQDAKDGYKEYLTDEALDIAIKTLEQESVLDKIRAEIRKKMKFNSFNEGYVLYDDITEVLNKYKAGEIDTHPINENIAKGFEEFTKMMFKQGQAERGEE